MKNHAKSSHRSASGAALVITVTMATVLTGCQWLPLNHRIEPEPAAAVAPWVSEPLTYFSQLQEMDSDERRRHREQALVDFLVQPDVARQVRLNLVLTASGNNLDEAREVALSLTGALAQDYALPTEAAAFLAGESLRLQQRLEHMEQADKLRAELARFGTRYRALQRNKTASDAALRASDAALQEAQENLKALTAIEKTLEATNGAL